MNVIAEGDCSALSVTGRTEGRGGGEEQGETVEVVVEEGKENEAGKQEVMVVFLSLGVEYRIPPDRLDALAVSA